jgi:hypothetical protein
MYDNQDFYSEEDYKFKPAMNYSSNYDEFRPTVTDYSSNYDEFRPTTSYNDSSQDGWGSLSQVFGEPSGGYNPMYPAGNNMGYNPMQPEATGGAYGEYNPQPGVGESPPPSNPRRERFLDRITPNQRDALTGATGLIGMFAQLQKAKALKAAARTQDPFGAQRPQYQSRLADTYSNPGSYFNRPEAMAQRALVERQMRAKAAASGGRYSASPQVMRDLYADDASRLNAYRTQLAGLSGSNIGPSGAAQLQSSAADANLNAISSPVAALGKLFGPSNSAGDNAGYEQLKQDIQNRLNKRA